MRRGGFRPSSVFFSQNAGPDGITQTARAVTADTNLRPAEFGSAEGAPARVASRNLSAMMRGIRNALSNGAIHAVGAELVKTVLVLDHGPANLIALAMILRAYGYVALEASSREEALSICRDCPARIDVLVAGTASTIEDVRELECCV